MPDSLLHPAGADSPGGTSTAPPPESAVRAQPATVGRIGLPLSVWPAIPGPGCPVPDGNDPPCPHHCPGTRARSVITAFSRPGDLVVMIPEAACAALAAAAASTGRRILGVTTSLPGADEQGGQRSPAGRSGAGSGGLPGGAGQAALAITVSCENPPPTGDATAAAPYPACQQALRPGGILAVLAGHPAPGGLPDLGLAVACARAAGLIYAQHIILVHAAIVGGQLRPFPAPRPAAPCPQDGQPGARAHSDLLIFVKPGGPE